MVVRCWSAVYCADYMTFVTLCSDQFVERDVAVVTQVFRYMMNVLHAAVAVQNERRLKLQTEVGRALIYIH